MPAKNRKLPVSIQLSHFHAARSVKRVPAITILSVRLSVTTRYRTTPI